MTPDHTLAEAKKHLRENWKKGLNCPCCGRLVKLYTYRLNAGMSLAMIRMYNLTLKYEPPEGWLHVQKRFAEDLNLNANALHYSLMKWWELLESQVQTKDPARTGSGFWRITPKGERFVRGEIAVPEKIYIYDNLIVERSDETTFIKEALGHKFNYAELMGYDQAKR